MATGILAVLGVVCLVYGAAILSLGSGTWFFAVWFALGAALVALAVCAHFGVFGRLPVAVRRTGVGCLAVAGLALAVALGCVASGFAEHGKPGLDYIVVLGAQVHEDGPSTVLRHRLDTAYDYLAANESTLCVVSGGQGPNEPWPEAQGMADYLVGRGIDSQRIILEDRSTTTVENLAFSGELMGGDPGSVGVVTNDFHVFRATAIARKLGFDDVCGIAAPSELWAMPNNALRECLGLGKDLLAGNL